MRVPIYEAVAHYKRNETLPYTEYFGLGFFSKLSLAEKALTESKNLIGFSDLADDSFSGYRTKRVGTLIPIIER